MTTVHLIANAHLDPVWLWRQSAGVVEALSTCRAAADLLEEHPTATFTRSDQWLYEQIEAHDPRLFQRIRELVREGRWSIVGGWYVQPDCNLPLADSFRAHMRLGRQYFAERFGVTVRTGYNVDSFGHHAMLPSLLREFDFDSYIMMRPGPQEKELPSSLFRWRSPDGQEVLTWRIVGGYCLKDTALLQERIQACIAATPPGIDHTMCFFGIGDHGGGPSRRDLAWIAEHADGFPDARLELSTPRRFFDAVLPFTSRFPVVQDELQQHAVGCYSVVRDIKTGCRRAENAILRAQRVLPMGRPSDESVIESAWKGVLFNQFHDILAGTSIPEAYDEARDQLGQACSAADSVTHAALFRRLVSLPGDPLQRIVTWNLSPYPHEGPLTHEPWMEWKELTGTLVDAAGAPVAYQLVQQPALFGPKKMLLWMDTIDPDEERIYRLQPQVRPQADPPAVETDLRISPGAPPGGIENTAWKVEAGEGPLLARILRGDGSALLGKPHLQGLVIPDPSDTWSHGLSSYEGEPAATFDVVGSTIEEDGPLRATLRVSARFRDSSLTLWLRLYAGWDGLDIDVHLTWNERLHLAKLVFPLSEDFDHRRDGIPGGELGRPQDGRECPLMDWTMTPGGTVIAAPDCYSMDGRQNHLRFTLVRSPVFAWHDPTQLDPDAHYRYTDQGEHRFRFRVFPAGTPERAMAAAYGLHSPPISLDWTRGEARGME